MAVMEVVLYFILLSFSVPSVIAKENVQVIETSVGQSVTLHCDGTSENSPSPLLYFNSMFYDINEIPDGYEVTFSSDGLLLTIDNVKLWMNDSVVGCYSVKHQNFQKEAQLYVNYNFSGPEDQKVDVEEPAFFECTDELVIKQGIVPLWKINNMIYDISQLSKSYVQTSKGLLIPKVKESQDGSTYQCYFYSNMLWKDKYYQSKEATLNVIKQKGTSINDPGTVDEIVKFDFNFQGFYFNNSENVTISWNQSTCSGQFDYHLTMILPNYNTSILIPSQALNATLPFKSLQKDGQDYGIIVEGRRSDGSVCDTTFTKVYIQKFLRTVEQKILMFGDVCLGNKNNGFRVMWPYSPDSNNFCTCIDLPGIVFENCSCIQKTDYEVVINEKNEMCWKNMTLNNTKIFYFLESSVMVRAINQIKPFIAYQLLQSFIVIIKDLPSAPHLEILGFDNKDYFAICISDIYDGHSDIILYEVSIEDRTTYSILVNKTSQGVPTCYSFEEYNKDNSIHCGDLEISVRSLNDVGFSTKERMYYYANTTDIDECECFQDHVQIQLNVSSVTSSGASIQLSCTTVYEEVDEINFSIQINSSNNEKKPAKCFETVEFYNLEATNNYKISAVWKPEPQKEWTCIMPKTHTFMTAGKSDSRFNTVKDYVEVIVPLVILLLLVVVVIVASVIGIRSIRRWYISKRGGAEIQRTDTL